MFPKVILFTLLLLKLQVTGEHSEELIWEKCMVCLKVLRNLHESLSSKELSDPKSIEKRFMDLCSKTRGVENRFCYYLGGTSDSATRILSEMSKPMSWGLPIEKICARLGSKDAQICDLSYRKMTRVWNDAVINKMKISELKDYLSYIQAECKDCVSRKDFIEKIRSVVVAPTFHKDEL